MTNSECRALIYRLRKEVDELTAAKERICAEREALEASVKPLAEGYEALKQELADRIVPAPSDADTCGDTPAASGRKKTASLSRRKIRRSSYKNMKKLIGNLRNPASEDLLEGVFGCVLQHFAEGTGRRIRAGTRAVDFREQRGFLSLGLAPVVPSFGTYLRTYVTADIDSLAVVAPRAREPAFLNTWICRKAAIGENEAVCLVLRRIRSGDIAAAALVAYLAAVEQCRCGPEDEVYRTLDIAVLIILSAKSVCIERILKSQEPAVPEEHLVTGRKHGHGLSGSHAGGVRERNVLAVEIVGKNIYRRRTRRAVGIPQDIRLRRRMVTGDGRAILAVNGEIAFAHRYNHLLEIDSATDKYRGRCLAEVRCGINSGLHGREVALAVLRHNEVIVTRSLICDLSRGYLTLVI